MNPFIVRGQKQKKMKELILAALRTKYDGVSDAILNRMADKIAKTVTGESGIAAAVEAITTQQLLEAYGDSRATEAANSAVANYEKKHLLKDGKSIETKTATKEDKIEPGEKEGATDLEQIKAAIAVAMAPITKELEILKAEKNDSSRKRSLEEALKDTPEYFKKKALRDFDRVAPTIQDDDAFEAYMSEIKEDAIVFSNETTANAAVFGTPSRGSGVAASKEPSKEDLAAVSAQLFNGL